jgi:hypothetical protein
VNDEGWGVTDSTDDLSPWDRRVLAAMGTAQAARTGVVVLRVIAGVVAVASIVGNYLWVTSFDSRGSSGDGLLGLESISVADRQQVGQFLTGVAAPLAFAGVLVAASYLLAVYAARLDLDVVRSDEDESMNRRATETETDDV